jgi:hypothetical protein
VAGEDRHWIVVTASLSALWWRSRRVPSASTRAPRAIQHVGIGKMEAPARSIGAYSRGIFILAIGVGDHLFSEKGVSPLGPGLGESVLDLSKAL